MGFDLKRAKDINKGNRRKKRWVVGGGGGVVILFLAKGKCGNCKPKCGVISGFFC